MKDEIIEINRNTEHIKKIGEEIKEIMAEISAQDRAHEKGKPCDEEDCQDCCGEFTGHEHDSSEGGYCLNCGHHPNT